MNLKFPLLLSGLVTLASSLSAQTAQFTDHSVEAGILGDYLNHTLSVADYDLDGDLDVYVGSRLAPNTLYRNEGNEVFVAVEAGVEDESFTMASLFFDYDNDGDPDLLSCNAGDANRFWRNDGGLSPKSPRIWASGPKPNAAVRMPRTSIRTATSTCTWST